MIKIVKNWDYDWHVQPSQRVGFWGLRKSDNVRPTQIIFSKEKALQVAKKLAKKEEKGVYVYDEGNQFESYVSFRRPFVK